MRRNPVNVFYYPDAAPAGPLTLKKSLLFFDEIHYMDRPSFMFKGGTFGSIGAASWLRQFQPVFEADEVPFFVHPAPNGPVEGERYDRIADDINDLLFLTRYQNGLKTSQTFCDFQVQPGNHGQLGTELDVAQKMIAVNLPSAIAEYGAPMDLFNDRSIHPYDLLTPLNCAQQLISQAVLCSAKINVALDFSTSHGFIPLADAPPFGDLLGAKYARAIQQGNLPKNSIQITDLSFAIFDELVPNDRLEAMTFEKVIAFRKASHAAREEFLEHLTVLQAKQGSISIDGDYAGAIEKIVTTEILPAVRAFRHKLESADDVFYGAIQKDAIATMVGGSALRVFGDLSWEHIIAGAGLAGAYVVKAAIDRKNTIKAAKRECAVSFLLSLNT